MQSRLSTRLFSVSALVGLGFAFYGAPAHAQQSELDALRQQITELQKRLDTLEAGQKKTTDTAQATPATTAKFPLTIGGLFQIHSLDYLSETVKTGSTPSSDTFRLRRAELRVTAPAITRRLSGTVMFDLARPDSTNLPGAFQGGANNILQDLQVSYKASSLTNTKTQLFLDAGQFKTPVGYEAALIPTANVPFLERSLIFSGRDRFNTTYGDQRDTGIQLRGITPEVEVRLGVFNGFGDRQNSLSSSDNKAIIGLVAYKPKSIRGLTIGASGGIGNTGVLYTTPATPTVPATSVNLRAHRNLANAFVVYKLKKLTLQSEFLRGNASSFLAGAATNEAINPQGYYIGGAYLVTPRLELLARYDTLDFNHKVDNATVRDYLIGLNYYLTGQNKLQINLVRREGAEGAPTSATNPAANFRNDRLELRTGVQLAF